MDVTSLILLLLRSKRSCSSGLGNTSSEESGVGCQSSISRGFWRRSLLRLLLPIFLLNPVLANDTAYRLAQGAFVAAQFADARTTELALDRGAEEANPLFGEHPSDVRLYATKAVLTVAVLAAAEGLRRRGRRRSAIVLLVLGSALAGVAAISNDAVMR